MRQTLATQQLHADRVRVLDITNTDIAEQLDAIRACFPPAAEQFSCETFVAGPLDHPFDLTWVHKKILTGVFLPDSAFSHFLYLEDDLELTPEGVAYWLEAREQLRPFGLIPSFFRVERTQGDTVWRSTDQIRRVCAPLLPQVRISPSLWFVNLPNPYQGLYLFDRELAAEHVAGPAVRKGFAPTGWQVRECAAQGQTFVGVPGGFIARNVVPFDPRDNSIPPRCFVHHLPNTYADDPASCFGKLAVPDGLLAPLRLNARTIWAGLAEPIYLATSGFSWEHAWAFERTVVHQVVAHLARNRAGKSMSSR
jgi:hypothetical protein